MDNAATTRLCDEAYRAMLPYLKDSYGNPGGLYDAGLEAKRAVGTAREDIARTINAEPSEIYFTSGGTEADNWAIKGVAGLFHDKHTVTAAFEHHAVLNTCRWLEVTGKAVSYAQPDVNGYISVEEAEKHICEDTVLISMMHINNELGTVQPVKELGHLAHKRGILFHTDAVASYGHIPIDVKEMNIDMMSVSAHKFGGPKGVGFLYVNGKIKLPPLLHGGAQEQGRRGGTENVAGIAGMAAAAVRAHREMECNLKKRYKLDNYFCERLSEFDSGLRQERKSGHIHLNGYVDEHKDERLPGCFSLTIPGANAEELIVRLGMEGICISAGAACASSDEGGSHVLKAIGLDRRAVGSTIRISMNGYNTKEEIDTFFETLGRLI